MDSKTRLLLPFALIVATLAVSTASVFIRYAQGDGAPSLVIAALRLAFATLLIAPPALTRHLDEIKRFTRTEILLGVFSGIFLAVHFASWITSLEYTSVANSVVFVSTGPLWVALLSPALLKEHLSRTAIVGLALALVGGTVIGLSDACSISPFSCPALRDILRGTAMWGNFLALIGAWTVSGYLVIGRRLRSRMSLVPYIFLVYGMAALTLLAFMLVSGISPLGYLPAIYGWIFLLAAVPQLLGHTTYNWLLKYLPATLVAVVTLAEPLGSAVLAYFFLNETPTTVAVLGGALILFGIYLSTNPTNTPEAA